jgi:hypothetical protein
MDLFMMFAILGGIYAILAVWHFPADWLFQTHKEALAKSEDHVVRALHCLVYTLMYVPLLLLLRIRDGGWGPELVLGWHFWSSLAILWLSHFGIDTYWPVMMWAKHLRKAPQFNDVIKPVTLTKEQLDNVIAGKGVVKGVGWSDKVVDRITYDSDKKAFKAFFATPIGAILCITMDQLFHLAFLGPVAWLVAN